MPDRSFEEKFSQMAFLNVQESAPSLMENDHWVGFQLVDKSDDDRHAMGVMAFVVNSLWLYVPIVYVSGSIKGNDILYIQPVDLHVPAQDAWVTSLKEKGMGFVGSLVNEMELDEYDESSQINLPSSELLLKESSDRFVDPGTIAGMFRRRRLPDADFCEKLAMLGDGAVMCLARTILDNPSFTNLFLEYHEPEELEKVSAMVAEIEARRSARRPSAGGLTVFRGMRDKRASELTDQEKRLLVKHGSYVRDDRERTSEVYTASDPSVVFSHPSADGLYKILMSDGSYAEREVAVGLDGGQCLVTGDGDTVVTEPSAIFAERIGEYGDLAEVTLRKLVSAVGNKGDKKILLSDGKRKMLVDPVFGEEGFRVRVNGAVAEPVFTGASGKLSLHGGVLVVPEGTVMKVMDWKWSEFRPGGLDTVSAALRLGSDYTPLALARSEKTGVMVRVRDSRKTFHDLTDAVEHLASAHGIYAGQARGMLEKAGETPSEYFVKNAAVDEGVRNPLKGTLQVSVVKETSPKVTPLNPGDIVDKLTRAAGTGLMEVFDTTVYKALVEGAGATSFRREFLMDMIRGMDSTARTMLILFWNYDMFKEQYGDKMAEVESKLKAVFENMGDLVLFMKERTDALPEGGDSLWGALAVEE